MEKPKMDQSFKKLPNKVSTEDLLKALENTEGNEESTKEVEEIFDYRNDVPLFLDKYGIEAGENPVSRVALYSLYLQFSEAPVPRQTFTIALNDFISQATLTLFKINLTRKQITALLHKKNKRVRKYSPASPLTRKHFELFLEENKLKNGTKWIESFLLIYIYKKWCRGKKTIARFKDKQFTKIAKVYLDHKKSSYINTWFKVNEDILTILTEEDKGRLRIEREKYKGGPTKKKKRKKRQSVRGARPKVESKV